MGCLSCRPPRTLLTAGLTISLCRIVARKTALARSVTKTMVKEADVRVVWTWRVVAVGARRRRPCRRRRGLTAAAMIAAVDAVDAGAGVSREHVGGDLLIGHCVVAMKVAIKGTTLSVGLTNVVAD